MTMTMQEKQDTKSVLLIGGAAYQSFRQKKNDWHDILKYEASSIQRELNCFSSLCFILYLFIIQSSLEYCQCIFIICTIIKREDQKIA